MVVYVVDDWLTNFNENFSDSNSYDPYNRSLTEEIFDHGALSVSRQSSVAPLISAEMGRKRLKIGIIQGTLGRQGK